MRLAQAPSALRCPPLPYPIRILLCLVGLGLGGARLAADEPTVGSSRDAVIARFGEPKATLSAGPKEILTYPTGRIILMDGKVTRMEIAHPPAAVAPPPPAPAAATPPAPTPAPKPVPEKKEPWLTDYAQAQAEAASSKRRILALFTGSDWCPACMQFESAAAHNADFLAFAQVSFVLLKLDYPMEHAQPPALKVQNEALRKQWKIEAYPTILILSADGTQYAKANMTKSRSAENMTDYYIQAVDEARHETLKTPSSWWPF